MDPNIAKPRVNGSMLSNCIGQYVCLVGKNLGISSDGLSVSIEASDGQSIGARFPHPYHDTLDPYVELLGKVENDCTITIQRIVNFGADFDLEAYNGVVCLTSSFPELFSASSTPSNQTTSNNMEY